jgi:tRNA pseudouridine55 synthase
MAQKKYNREEIDRIFVAYKPSGIGSNKFLSQLKWKYNAKKAGFSGTLDPFAKGVLIIAFGRLTRLFSHLKKTPKTYRATLWLGVQSDTLDIEKGVTHLSSPLFSKEKIKETLNSFLGDFTYVPPKYSAKKIDGKRAYELARAGEDVILKTVTSQIHDIKFLNYAHPFVTFEASVSEGTYIRSLGQHIAESLGTTGVLSMLERLHEGIFYYDNEKPLDPINLIDAEENNYFGDEEDLQLGKKIALSELKIQEDGKYIIPSKDNFAIIAITNGEVSYLLNRVMQKC